MIEQKTKNIRDLLTENEKIRLKKAVEEFEVHSWAELRVHIELNCKETLAKERAAKVFKILSMHKTKARNGILLYLAIEDRKIAVIGDVEIDKRLSNNEEKWQEVVNVMIPYCKKEEFFNALKAGIDLLTTYLKQELPSLENDKNELSDEISIG